MDPLRESYSGFDGTTLEDELDKRDVKRLFVGRLATDYCVKNTVLDALKLGFETILLTDATQGINSQVRDSERAIDEMMDRGARKATLPELPDLLEVSQKKQSPDKMEEKSLRKTETKKKARLRTRGPYRKANIQL